MNKSMKPVYESVHATATAVHDAFEPNGNVKALIQVEGLSLYSHDEITGVNIFELSGLKRREIDYGMMLTALGFSEQEREDPQVTVMVETIDRAVQDHDIMQLLKSRVKFIG